MDELFYKHVLVHPELTNDPMHAQGEIGRIDVIDYREDEVFVMLANNKYGLYEANALLVLQPPERLLENLKSSLDELTKKDMVAMLNIYLWQNSREDEHIREALTLAIGNDALRDKALINLRDWIDNGLSDDYNYGADWTPGRGM
jgi:hypothetical protein